nr:MAG TPA: hypothetical protein [Caudoviricetes sp.]
MGRVYLYPLFPRFFFSIIYNKCRPKSKLKKA